MQLPEIIKNINKQIEEALWELELRGKITEALEVYRHAEVKLQDLKISSYHSDYRDQQRILSYCLMRQCNIVRQMNKIDEALVLGNREIMAAQESGDNLTLARSLMSNGANFIVSGNIKEGLEFIEKARGIFESHAGNEYQQGLERYWILRADIANASLISSSSPEIIEMANQSLVILKPMGDWPGVARAYGARAAAYRHMGQEDEAETDFALQEYYECKEEANEDNTD